MNVVESSNVSKFAREFVVYDPVLNIIYTTVATFQLDYGVYYKMFNIISGSYDVVVNLGAL